ncbi:MAG TPA: RNA polymerase sigma factor [Rhizomicrobium sp.]|nr:RNA polymerase sigma factor [Rhizomicrobium sp.]
MNASSLDAWFVREVLPLEAALMHFLRLSRRNAGDAEDLCQDVYVRVYEAAKREIPHPVKPYVFTVARNLLINHAKRDQIVSIDSMADLDELGIALDEPLPDRSVMARQELHRLEDALNQLPPRCREVVVLSRIEGLTRREIAQRMGIVESTVSAHLTDGMYALADQLYGTPTKPGRKS